MYTRMATLFAAISESDKENIMLQGVISWLKGSTRSRVPSDVVIYCNPDLVATSSVCDTQIDPTFAAALAERHFSPRLENMKAPTIMQAFLRDYFNNPVLVITEIIEYKDWSTGLPSYMYKYL